MKLLRRAMQYKVWLTKVAIVSAIIVIIVTTMFSRGQNAVPQRLVDECLIRDRANASSTGVRKPLHESSSTAAFASNCNPEYLYNLRYSDPFKTSRPIPNGRKVPCPRRLQAANFPIPYTGLLTSPGSGNTWARHLLQELTGLPTGSSSDPDENLKKKGFPFEGQLERVIAVKTHGKMHAQFNLSVPTNDFSRLIVVIRNPYYSFLAEYKRLHSHGNHTGHVIINTCTYLWDWFVSKRISDWSEFFEDILNFPRPVFVTFYEDLQAQLLTELIRLSEFLVSKDVTEFSFCCALENPAGNFRRPKSNLEIEDLYPQASKLRINEAIEKIAIVMREKHPEISGRLYSYRLPV